MRTSRHPVYGLLLPAVGLAFAWVSSAFAYSHVPLPVDEIAALSSCVAQGVVRSAAARRAGNAIVTDFAIDVERASGDCRTTAGRLTFTVYGGRLPTGQSAEILGLEMPQVGERYLVMLEARGAENRTVLGPQGQIALERAGAATVRARDATGMRIVGEQTRAANGTTQLRFGKGAQPAHPVQERGATPKATGTELHEFDPQALFQYAADHATRVGAAEKARQREALAQRLIGPTPERAGVKLYRPDPAQQPAARSAPLAEPAAVRRVRCSKAPPPGTDRGCEEGAPSYRVFGSGGLPWNIPPVLTQLGPVATQLMVEWNTYAAQFRVFTEPNNFFGLNGRNDLGGFVADAPLQSIYGTSWNGALGIALRRREYCTEITEVTLFGIVIDRYCSAYADETDVFLNSAYNWTLDDAAVRNAQADFNVHSVYEVLFHELGHGLGLGHSSDLAAMIPCTPRKGWRPWPDDAAGARAVWPSLARSGANVGVRLTQLSGSFPTCGSPAVAFPHTFDTSVFYSPFSRTVDIGSHFLVNLDTQARDNVVVEWYLTQNIGSFAPGTYAFLGTTSATRLDPGVTTMPGASFTVPQDVAGRRYVAAFIRDAGGVSNTDALNVPIDLGAGGVFQFAQPHAYVPEGAGSVAIEVVRRQSSAGAASVRYYTLDQNAVSGVNYAFTSGTLQWADGDASPKTITVPIRNDGVTTGGFYVFSVVLASDFGITLGDPAVIDVAIVDDSPDSFPMGCAMPNGAGWVNNPPGTTAGWGVDSSSLVEGRCSLKSGAMGDNGVAELRFTGDFSAGNVTFWRRVSSEQGFDCFSFLIDGVPQPAQAGAGNPPPPGCFVGSGDSGEVDWAPQSASIAAGRHTLTWRFAKDGSVARGADAAWIDALSMPLAVAEPAAILRPANGARLAGASQTFEWNAAPDATAYQVWVGTTPGASDLGFYPAGGTTETQITIGGLPTDGRTLYVRLYSLIRGAYHFRDFTYVAAAAPSAAAILSPAPGSTLAGAEQAFEWEAAGATLYQLWIGSSPGTFDIGYFPPAGTSATTLRVTGLPTDGRVLYVRLYSLIGGVYSFRDFTYTSATLVAAPAILTSPASGATLGGASQTFEWTNAGAALYQLWVGSSQGTYDIGYFPAAGTTATTLTVSGLPVDGRTLHVRLYSLIGGVWQYVDATYVAATAAPSPAALVAPANGSRLGGASQLFQWNDAGAALYQLWIGSSPGASDVGYFPAAGTTATSVLVDGLPVDGRALYVRLYSAIGGSWYFTDTVHAAASAGPATMLSPAPGSTLASASVTMQWTDSGAQLYQVWVGSSPGALDLGYFPATGTTATSTVVTGLPLDGRVVYVRLYSAIAGSWHFRDYTYTMGR